jgi:SAM-dependent methyltransferase
VNRATGAAYDAIGQGYGVHRKPDPRIAAALERALGDSSRVVNIGAGTGSYEPAERSVVAVEPSAVMIAQRPSGSAPCVQARAEALPFGNHSFDAAMAVLTTHHWTDAALGLREMARVSRLQVVLTWDKRAWDVLWLVRDYFPQIRELETDLAALDEVLAVWPDALVEPVPVPADCVDGFLAAYWQRPEAYLDPQVRSGISSFARLPAAVVEAGLERLADDLATRRWADRHHELLRRTELDCGYRLVVHRT